MKKVTIYYPENTPKPALDLLQKAVGGLIEPVDAYLAANIHAVDGPHAPVDVAYANEEAMIRGLTPNRDGTSAVRWPHPLRGPVVVVQGWTRAEHTGELDD